MSAFYTCSNLFTYLFFFFFKSQRYVRSSFFHKSLIILPHQHFTCLLFLIFHVLLLSSIPLLENITLSIICLLFLFFSRTYYFNVFSHTYYFFMTKDYVYFTMNYYFVKNIFQNQLHLLIIPVKEKLKCCFFVPA